MPKFLLKSFAALCAVILLLVGGFYYRYGQPIQDTRTRELVAQYLNTPLDSRAVVNHLIVEKSRRILSVYHDTELLKVYHVSLSRMPKGHKLQQGDKKTPEGRYYIVGKNSASKYHLSMRISYPNTKDREYARRQGKSPGGDIMIHGLPNHGMLQESIHRRIDWTDGCIAVNDEEIDELFAAVRVGAVIDILP